MGKVIQIKGADFSLVNVDKDTKEGTTIKLDSWNRIDKAYMAYSASGGTGTLTTFINQTTIVCTTELSAGDIVNLTSLMVAMAGQSAFRYGVFSSSSPSIGDVPLEGGFCQLDSAVSDWTYTLNNGGYIAFSAFNSNSSSTMVATATAVVNS